MSDVGTILVVIWSVFFLVAIVVVIMGIEERLTCLRRQDADRRGKEHLRRFIIPRMRNGQLVFKEWGCWCYKVDACGRTRKCWWENRGGDRQIPVQ